MTRENDPSDPLHDLVGEWLRATTADTRPALAYLHARMDAPSPTTRSPQPRYRMAMYLSAASVVCALLLGGVLGTWWYKGTGTPAIREFATAVGSRSRVVLSDGTVLTLGPATVVRVPATFGRGSRTVELHGEALFAVIHDSRHPFAVKTPYTTVRDIGTTFTVRAYDDEPDERVAVSAGQVNIAGNALVAGTRAVLHSASQIIIDHHADVSDDMAWSQGGLVFRQTPLPDVIREVSRTYGLVITIADSSLRTRTITATFSNEPVEEVLEAITRTLGATYARNGHQVTLARRLGPAVLPPGGRVVAMESHE